MKFRLIAIALVLMNIAAYSAWSPTSICTTLFLPSDFQFKELKLSVCSYLSTSWVTQEKAHCIMDLVVLTQPKVCVDIGTFIGSSSLPIAVALRYLGSGKVYLIDAWSNQEAVKHISLEDHHYHWWSTLDMEDVKRRCLAMIHEWSLEPYCQVMHAPSEEVVHQIDQIDFLHLDGNFSAEGSLLDATLYVPKVRSGGYILLSNAFMTVHHTLSKAATIWFLYYECELVAELESSNAKLFRKQ